MWLYGETLLQPVHAETGLLHSCCNLVALSGVEATLHLRLQSVVHPKRDGTEDVGIADHLSHRVGSRIVVAPHFRLGAQHDRGLGQYLGLTTRTGPTVIL
jgi:hypothetical protein